MKRDFLTLTDLSRPELLLLLRLAEALKTGAFRPAAPPLAGRTLLLLFDKPSTRTRISFQVGMFQLGGLGIELRSQETQINRGEPVADTARVLSRYGDAVCIRTFAQSDLEEWARQAGIPVINALSDTCHPCQILADLLTIRERRGRVEGTRLTYVGDGNNVLHSLAAACCLLDIELTVSTPAGYEPDPAVMEALGRRGWRNRAPRVVRDPRQAVAGADVLYTDVWTSMGQEEERERRLAAFSDYQVNAALVEAAGTAPQVLHCLPAHRGEEITDDVFEAQSQEIFRQAENRLHTQKALLLFLMAPGVVEQFRTAHPGGDSF